MNKIFDSDRLEDIMSIQGGCFIQVVCPGIQDWKDYAFEVEDPVENLGFRLIRRV